MHTNEVHEFINVEVNPKKVSDCDLIFLEKFLKNFTKKIFKLQWKY